MPRGLILWWGATLVVTAGCAPAFHNAPLETYAPQKGYRFDSLQVGEGNTDDVLVCLTFSGGGVRAASLAYGVLQELRDTPIGPLPGRDAPRRMLDEVDVISSVSGGSFTAAGYALWRDRLFDGRFEREFLKRNVQASLIWRTFSFPNALLLPLVALDRIDVVAEYFTANLFERRTYGDLLRDGRRPFVVINATSLSAGQRFEFTQDDFDLLGSDLTQLPLGYAVAGSQAVPILFSPLRLKYYAAEPSRQAIERILSERSTRLYRDRREAWALNLVPAGRQGEPPGYGIDPDAHRYLYLMDGALSDNLGLSYVIENYREGPIRRWIERDGGGGVRRLVVIIVNARTRPADDIERRDSTPGFITMGYKAATTSIQNYSDALTRIVRWTLVEETRRAREQYERSRRALEACCPAASAPAPPPEHRLIPYVIEVNFEDVRDDRIRQILLGLGTNYHLPPDHVDQVIAAGRELLRNDPEFQRLLQDVRKEQAHVRREK